LLVVLAARCGRPFVRRSRMAQDAAVGLHHLHGDWQIFAVFANDQFAVVGVLKHIQNLAE